MTDFFSSLSSYYNGDMLNFLSWLSVDEMDFILWEYGPDEVIARCERRDRELLLDMTGCLDAKL